MPTRSQHPSRVLTPAARPGRADLTAQALCVLGYIRRCGSYKPPKGPEYRTWQAMLVEFGDLGLIEANFVTDTISISAAGRHALAEGGIAHA